MTVNDDNVQIGIGNTSGAQIATDYDTVDGIHYQLIKLVHGNPDTGFTYVGQGTGDDSPLPVRLFADDNGSNPFRGITIGSTQALQVNILGAHGNTGIATLWAGTADDVLGYPMVNVGNTSDVWAIRSLTGGTVGYDGGTAEGLDFVIIQGISGGFEIAITGGASPLPVQGTDLDIRSLTGGTGSLSSYTDGFDNTDVDFVAVQGVSLGYPVGARLYGGSGATIAPVGMSGNAIDVNLVDSTELGVTVDTINVQGTATVSATDLDIRSLTGGTGSLSSYTDGFDNTDVDFVAVQGVSLGYPVGARIYGGDGSTVAPVGMSGSALNVNILDAGITVNVDVTDTSFLVSGFTGTRGVTAPPISIKGYTGDGITFSPVYVAGIIGATAIGVSAGAAFNVQGTATVSATDLDIRNLTGGTVGSTSSNYPWDRDFVVVQGISSGFPVGSSIMNHIGNVAAGVSGTGLTDGSVLSYITNEVGVTFGSDLTFLQSADSVGVTFATVNVQGTATVSATDLDIRSLTGGTGSLSSYTDGFDNTDVDFVAVQGVSLGYPVGARLYAGSGATIVPIGVSANALDVNIIGTDTVVNVDITDTQFMVSGNSTGDFVRVSGTGGGAVVIAGLEGATAIAVTGGGQPLAITGGASPLPVQGSDFDIRGLTFDGSVNDVVGISGPMFETLSGMSSDVGGISTGIDEIRTWMENTNTHGATLPNAGQLASLIGIDFALEDTGNLEILADGMTGGGVGKGMRVFVVDNIQPPTLFNGQTTVPTSTAVALSTTQPIKSGVNIKAHQQNTASVFVGAGGVGVETGYPLSAGEEIFLEVNNIITPFVIASSAGQTACWTAS